MLKQIAPFIGPALIFVIIGWRLFRGLKGQAIKPNRLWIRPAILFGFLVLAFLHPPQLTVISVVGLIGAGVLGVWLGFVRAQHQTLTMDPATGTITSKMSPIGSLLFVAIFGLRYVLRLALTGGAPPQSFHPETGTALLVADALLVFLVAMVAAMAFETWQRARVLLAGHSPPPVVNGPPENTETSAETIG